MSKKLIIKEKLIWFALAMFLLAGIGSCKKEEDPADQRLINKENKEAGEQFLEENKANEGVHQTSSGLQYKVEAAGTGLRPVEEDSVNITYTGRLIDETEFTSATEDVLPIKQIAGFQEGVLLMNEGAKYTLYIPYYLAYGSSAQSTTYNGKTVVIQPYSVLIFEITLNRVTKN